MRTQVDQYPHLALWIASVALFCVTGIAALVLWIPTAIGNPKDHPMPAASSRISIQSAGAIAVDKASAGAVNDAPTRTTCAECGVVESVREIDPRGEQAAESTRIYEVTIRFRDGSKRVFSEATPRMWRSGTAVKIID
jgi:hypothetical protein